MQGRLRRFEVGGRKMEPVEKPNETGMADTRKEAPPFWNSASTHHKNARPDAPRRRPVPAERRIRFEMRRRRWLRQDRMPYEAASPLFSLTSAVLAFPIVQRVAPNRRRMASASRDSGRTC